MRHGKSCAWCAYFRKIKWLFKDAKERKAIGLCILSMENVRLEPYFSDCKEFESKASGTQRGRKKILIMNKQGESQILMASHGGTLTKYQLAGINHFFGFGLVLEKPMMKAKELNNDKVFFKYIPVAGDPENKATFRVFFKGEENTK